MFSEIVPVFLSWIVFAFLVGYLATLLNPYYLYKTPGATLFIGSLGIVSSAIFLAFLFGSVTVRQDLIWLLFSTFLSYLLFVFGRSKKENEEVII